MPLNKYIQLLACKIVLIHKYYYRQEIIVHYLPHSYLNKIWAFTFSVAPTNTRNLNYNSLTDTEFLNPLYTLITL